MNAKECLDLPYGIIIRHRIDEGDEYFFASVEEMPGCMCRGASAEETMKNIRFI
jgi:predicted RNase H-like HicB family nuclease